MTDAGSSHQRVSLPHSSMTAAITDPASDPRRMRRIIAEDPNWNVATVPNLVQLCLDFLVTNFTETPILDQIPKHQQPKLLANLDINMPLRITAKLIEDEGYWERCCKARKAWQPCRVADYGQSWKRMFFERNLEDMIETCKPECEEEEMDKDDGILAIAELSAPYIRKLRISQLMPPDKCEPEQADDLDPGAGDSENPLDADEVTLSQDHIDLTPIIRKLTGLKTLDVTYGVNECGMDFKWAMFGMTSNDCGRLSRGLRDYSTLSTLVVNRSHVGDSKCRTLCYFLMNNKTLKKMDLSHNSIGDSGARAIAKLLNGNSVLEEVDLRDNKIRAVGAKALGKALSTNKLMRSLNVRLNRFEDLGGRNFFDAAARNETLLELNVSSNGLGKKTSTALCDFLDHNPSLVHIDISCNELGEEAGRLILEGLDGNTVLKTMDMRLTKFDKETEYQINVLMTGNIKLAQQGAGN